MKSGNKKGDFRGTGLTVFVLVIVAAVILIAFSIFRLIRLNSISKYTDVQTDGTVTTTPAETDEERLEKIRRAVPADVVMGDNTQSQPSVSVVFSGLNDDVTVNEEILKILDKYGDNASFAVSAIEVRENLGILQRILKDGDRVIGGGMYAEKNGKQAELAFADLLMKSKEILDEESGLDIKTLYYPGMSLSLMNLKAAGAAGYDRVVAADDHDLIDESSFHSKVGKNGTIPELTEDELKKARNENNGRKAAYLTTIPTTEKSLALTFGNIANEAVDLDVASILRDAGGAGTFFLNFDEMRTNTGTVEKLIDMGQEIGILFTPAGSYTADYSGTAHYIHDCLCYMKWRYNYAPRIVMMTKEPSDAGVLEAVHASGMSVVGASHRMILNGTENMTAGRIPKALKDLSGVRFTRGGLAYFNLNYFDKDKASAVGDHTVMGEMVSQSIRKFVDSIAFVSPLTGKIEDESRYSLKTVSGLLSSNQVYSLVAKEQDDISLTKNVLTSMDSDQDRFEYMKTHYLGSNFIVNEKKMPGFTKNEIRQMDKTGKLTDDKVLFLTFDDWGSDESVNKLLYVLDKYDVKATFFVLTEHVDSNPNLLRAIAAGGHEIASHSNSHVPLSDANKDFTRYSSLTDKEQKAMRKDLVTSYEKLNRYVGDVYVDGEKALSRDFRPPTLEISKEGLYQVFDVGFLYSISGDVTTNDYKAESLDKLIDRMTNGSPSSEDDYRVGNGSVIVMHMTENARYTAQMLDVMIPRWKKQGYSFAKVDEYAGRYEP